MIKMETDKIMDETNSNSQTFSPTMLYDHVRKKESSPTYHAQCDTCLSFFNQWSEGDQVHFVEQLLSRMCHYQHGHINAYLKPMLQRDFISLLPSFAFERVEKADNAYTNVGVSKTNAVKALTIKAIDNGVHSKQVKD